MSLKLGRQLMPPAKQWPPGILDIYPHSTADFVEPNKAGTDPYLTRGVTKVLIGRR